MTAARKQIHDDYPNKWWLEHTKNSDLAIHECFAPPSIMVNKSWLGLGLHR